MPVKTPRDRRDFDIALICALPLEAECVQEVFDGFWEDEGKKYGKAPGDPNVYTTGVIGEHNVVLAYMPGMGTTSAAAVAGSLRVSFPNIKLALVVGICGGIPYGADQEEIVLGDVIISQALVQYDFGRQYSGGFKRKDDLRDTLGRPSPEIRAVQTKLGTSRYKQKMQNNITTFLQEIERKLPKTKYPGQENDILYHSSYVHQHHSPTCDECGSDGEICELALKTDCEDLGCESIMRVTRNRLMGASTTQPEVHFGIMGSGNTVMKSGQHRDRMAQADGIISFEMEGAGVWDYFPSIVIKGVCDYADSHKRKGWQRYAAAAAAACTKAFLVEWNVEGAATDSAPHKPHWLVPFGRNRDFVGRREIMDRLLERVPPGVDEDNCQRPNKHTMAEVAAVGLAANILQFIDFGTKVGYAARKIHQSGEDGIESLRNVRNISSDMKDILEQLKASGSYQCDTTRPYEGMVKLAKVCSVVLGKQLDLLASLDIPNQAVLPRRRRTIRAVREAVTLTWSHDEIDVLQDTLNNFRDQLSSNLLVCIRDIGIQSLTQQETILQELHSGKECFSSYGGESGLCNDIHMDNGLGYSIIDCIGKRLEPSNSGTEKEKLQQKSLWAIYQGDDSNRPDPSSLYISDHRKEKLQKRFIQNFHYLGIEKREIRIEAAHQNTFRWIFEDSNEPEHLWSNFRDWLQSDSQLYWIAGKAGSGKSTLMKYICHSRKDDHEQLLRNWAGEKLLVVASFYFWNQEREFQATRKGLLMSLLFQILSRCPDIIPSISPRRWEALCLFDHDSGEWSEEEIHTLFRHTIKTITLKAKLCLFVDGLDEFNDGYDALLETLREIRSCPNVKICTSSRPETPFEKEFNQDRKLRLEHLTRPDILQYVGSRLHQDPYFAQLQRIKPDFAAGLIEGIITKASGVFLWVKIVVSSLIAAIECGDRDSKLQNLLDELPKDLQDLYDSILYRLDQSHAKETAQIFKLMESIIGPPSALHFYLTDEYDVNSVLKLAIEPMSRDAKILHIDTMRRRISSRCKGLLEVDRISDEERGDPSAYTVQYLHKTVKEYIDNHAKEKLNRALDQRFDPCLRLCAGTLALLKFTDPDVDPPIGPSGMLTKLLENCLDYGARALPCSEVQMIQLLDDLEKTGKTLLTKYLCTGEDFAHLSSVQRKRIEAGFWVTSRAPLTTPLPDKPLDYFGCTFLSLAVRRGVVSYVGAKALSRGLVQKAPGTSEKSLLQTLVRRKESSDAMWPLLLDANRSRPPNEAMFRRLLEIGVNPNDEIDNYKVPRGSSLWVDTLANMIVDCSGDAKYPEKGWGPIIRLMIDHGAKVNKNIFDLALRQPSVRRRTGSDESELVWLQFESSAQRRMMFEALKLMKQVRNQSLELTSYELLECEGRGLGAYIISAPG